jgi:formamidopyrimidine-DNA glycosylase
MGPLPAPCNPIVPELPEVETVRRGLDAEITGATISGLRLHRTGLRFPFPSDMAERLDGQTIVAIHRRAKFLLFELSSGTSWLTHLGMTGTFRLETHTKGANGPPAKHQHVTVNLDHGQKGPLRLAYIDPRRFGFMDMVPPGGTSRHLERLGPEPLGNQFSAPRLAPRLANRKAPVKTMLLDQSLVAGLGNIYVCEALFAAGIDPRSPGGALTGPALERLVAAIRHTLDKAIDAGGSSLNDFFSPDGRPGYFQHRFCVYGRAGSPCVKPGCKGEIERLVQAGRATFWCPVCQRLPDSAVTRRKKGAQ